MLMYLTSKNFNKFKNELRVENSKSLVVVCILISRDKNILNIIHKLGDENSEILLGVVNIDRNFELFTLMKSMNIEVNSYPTFALFKFGVFDRFLKMKFLNSNQLRMELKEELDAFKQTRSKLS